jgi:hypothetical protein
MSSTPPIPGYGGSPVTQVPWGSGGAIRIPGVGPAPSSGTAPGGRPAVPGSAGDGLNYVSGGGSSPANPAPTLTTTGQRDPEMDKYLADLRARLSGLQKDEKAPLTEDTKRTMDLAGGRISDQAEGEKQRLRETLADRGMSSGGPNASVADQYGAQIDARTAEAKAKASADIALAAQRRQEDMDLARGNALNSFLIGMQGATGANANLMLSQQQLGLSTWNAQQQAQQYASDLDWRKAVAAAQMAQQPYQPPAPPPAAVPGPPSTSYGGGSYGGGYVGRYSGGGGGASVFGGGGGGGGRGAAGMF